MSCFICNGQSSVYQRLGGSKIRFMRKAYPGFQDSSLLCNRCLAKFEKIFENKKKHKNRLSSISVGSNVSIETDSKSSNRTENISLINGQNMSSKENSAANSNLQIQIQSISTLNDTLDSTDRLVNNKAHLKSLRDSLKISKATEIDIARENAHGRKQSARRRTDIQGSGAPQTPTGRSRSGLSTVVEDDDGDIISLGTSTLSHIRPIVKKRKQPVVHLNQDVMDIYLANTSGG